MRTGHDTAPRPADGEWQGVSALQIIQAVALIVTFGTILGISLINAVTNWTMGQKPFLHDGNDAWFSGYLLRNSADAAGRQAGRIG